MKKHSTCTLIICMILAYLLGMSYPLITKPSAKEVEYKYQMQIQETNQQIQAILEGAE